MNRPSTQQELQFLLRGLQQTQPYQDPMRGRTVMGIGSVHQRLALDSDMALGNPGFGLELPLRQQSSFQHPDMSWGLKTESVDDKSPTGPSSPAGTSTAQPGKKSGTDGAQQQQQQQQQPRKKKTVRWQQQQLVALQQQLDEQIRVFDAVFRENQRLHLRLKILEDVLPVTEYQLKLLKGEGGNELPPLRGVKQDNRSSTGQRDILSGRASSTPSLSSSGCLDDTVKKDLREHCLDRTVAVWMDMIRKLSLLLMTVDAHPTTASDLIVSIGEQLESSYHALNVLLIERPQVWFDALTLNLQTGAAEVPPESHWQEVVRKIHFTPDQYKAAKAALQLFEEQMKEITAERHIISASLARLLSSCSIGNTTMRTDVRLGLEDLTQQFKANVLKERTARTTVIQFVGYSAFGPLSTARLCCLSFPYLTDCVAVLHAIVAKADEAAPDIPQGPAVIWRNGAPTHGAPLPAGAEAGSSGVLSP